ncbi:DUF4957 domain-containing protein [Flavobacterium adhaerens]|uniref:DUF4957 domain-containing protein n=1 Tax=Flavobacterium adhaerens TaxID=3149043 RepID=UPI0032B5D3D3
MKIKYIIKGLVAILVLSLAITSCESYNEELLNGIGNTREFSPIDLKANVRNRTSVELNWTTNENVDHYVIEFSADDTEFTTIAKTVKVTASELPVLVALEPEILYSIRVKAVTTGLEDSKWSITSANTLSEQLFLPTVDGDIQGTQAILRWTPNSAVTEIVITPGDIKHTITATEKSSGIATITGLTGETTYTADLFNGTKRRGSQIFTTGLDIGDGVLITTSDDLIQVIADAADGATLVLEPGDYTAQIGNLTISKSLTIRGLRSYDKPKLNFTFSLVEGVTNFSLIDLDLTSTKIDGNTTELSGALITTKAGDISYGDISINGCNVHDFAAGPIFYANVKKAKIKSLTIDNSNFRKVTTGTDLIDFRESVVSDLIIKNSTFDSCTSRDFIREDNKDLSGTGLTSNILIENSTFYKITANRILYVRFATNVITVRNTLFAETTAVYTNQTTTSAPTFSKNNYFNATGLQDASATNNTPDASGSKLDPQFKDAANGDLTIQNQTLIDEKIGDLTK